MNFRNAVLATLFATLFASPVLAQDDSARQPSAVEKLFESSDPVAPLSAADEILQRAKERCGGHGTAYPACQHEAALEAAIFAAETEATAGIVDAWSEARVAEADTAAFRAFTVRDKAALKAATAANNLAEELGTVVLTKDHEAAVAELEASVAKEKKREGMSRLIGGMNDLAENKFAEKNFRVATEHFTAVCNDGWSDAADSCQVGGTDITGLTVEEVTKLLQNLEK